MPPLLLPFLLQPALAEAGAARDAAVAALLSGIALAGLVRRECGTLPAP